MSRVLACLFLTMLLNPAAATRGTGDLGLFIERASSSVQIVETTGNTSIARIADLGDLSHASVVYSRDARYAYLFGRDGGLSKIDILLANVCKQNVTRFPEISIGFFEPPIDIVSL